MGDRRDTSEDSQLPAWAQRRQALARRPTWVVVLAMAMMAFGGHLLTGGLSILRGLGASEVTMPAAVPSGDAAAEASAVASRDLAAVARSAGREHPWAVRGIAAAKVSLGLLLLFAVAAVLTWDPRGRMAVLIAAWAGIAYHIGDALFLFLVVRKGVVAAAPQLASLAAANGETLSPEAMASLADTAMLIVTLVTTAVGMAFSVVLLTYFGGRRGRALYGFGQPPHHGA